MDMQSFAAQLQPLAEIVAGIDLADPAAARAELERLAPVDGELVGAIRSAAEAGAEAGWLLPKEAGGLQFGRVAKDLAGASVDAVRMIEVAGPKHRHPNGEVDLCFALHGEPRFDGHAPGWVVYGAGSAHVPRVSGGGMLILYFLPGGAIEWL